MPPVAPQPTQTTEEQDRQWLETVYRGDKEPDLTPRAVIAGMAFGGLMSLSNLYVGLKSGWGLGVDIAAVIVIFAVFSGLRNLGLVQRPFGIMENTITMTVAVAASWFSSAGLVSAVPALTMLTGYRFVWWHLTLLIAVVLYLGLIMAIPLKRQMIQVDSLRFPANIPTGETLKAMYSQGRQAVQKATAMGIAGGLGVVVAGLRDGLGWIPDEITRASVRIGGVGLSQLTLTLEPSLIFLGIGALFGIKVGLSMLLGLVVNYGVLAPHLIDAKVIHHPPPQIRAVAAPTLPLAVPAGSSFTVLLKEASAGPEFSAGARTRSLSYRWSEPAEYRTLGELEGALDAPTLKDGSPNPFYNAITFTSLPNKTLHAEVLALEAPQAVTWQAQVSIPTNQPPELVAGLGFRPGATARQDVGGFRNISAWSLWPGATVLVVGGLLALAFQWRTLGRTFASVLTAFRQRPHEARGALDHLEMPMTWFVFGFGAVGLAATLLLMWLLGIHWWMGVIAVVMTFFLAAVAARAGAEIGINPIGALGKVTQLTYGVLAPGNVATNLMTANVTAGAACSCSDTVGNLKVGHMVGANPRRQFIAQLFGVLAGALLAVPAYFILVPDANALGGEKFPAPSALIWMGVAKVLSRGLSTLPRSAVMAIGVAFLLGVIIVVVDRVFPRARPYTPSPAALGIAMTIPASTSFAMFLGAFIVWVLERKAKDWHEMYTIPIASGCIAGESIMGVILAVLMAFGVLR